MRALPKIALLVVVAVILALTLWPSPRTTEQIGIACIFCGQRWAADAIANVMLFMPLGAALLWGWPQRRALWRFGLLLSLGIELTQTLIAGRDPSLGDVITNTLGTAAGAWLVAHLAATRTRQPALRAGWLASLLFASTVGLAVWMLGPVSTEATYYGQWTPVLGHLEWYRGRVVSATLNGAALPSGRLSDSSPARAFVAGHGRLVVHALAGPRVPALASLVSVYDEAQRELFLLGPDRDALALRFRRRARVWGFDEPDVRLEHAFQGVSPGDSLMVTAERTPRGVCLALNARATCLPAGTPGRGWSLIYYPEGFPAWFRGLLDVGFLLGLAIPVGWYAGLGRRAIVPLVIVAAAVLWLPLAGQTAAAPAPELLGAVGGLMLGGLARRLLAVR